MAIQADFVNHQNFMLPKYGEKDWKKYPNSGFKFNAIILIRVYSDAAIN